MTSSRLHEYLDFAIQTAHEAGRLTLGYFQTGIRPDMKADDTPVTAADRASAARCAAPTRPTPPPS